MKEALMGYGKISTVVLACVGEGAHTDHENISVAHMLKTALAYARGAVDCCHSCELRGNTAILPRNVTGAELHLLHEVP